MSYPILARGRRAGFSLIELVVVILILTILAGVIVPRLSDRQAAARDARRLSDLRTVRDAIEQYYLDKSAWPAAASDASGWDTTHVGNFIHDLVEEGYMREVPRDPVNDATHNYQYAVFAKGTYGCAGSTPFYVLGLSAFELPANAASNPGYFKCSGHDFADDFEYVTGGGASFR
ncbi:MAG: prepilin-type N-terminal cleavage/methylation domain-containing protein [bacterium]|nr:prepilin-type N-terminal cleavage/methylation domain-containing protein [bacterium]